MNEHHLSWSNVKAGVPEGFILDPMFFNIYQ